MEILFTLAIVEVTQYNRTMSAFASRHASANEPDAFPAYSLLEICSATQALHCITNVNTIH